ncbi:MAG: hypothetical protein GY821_04845 [Gammaproteobacteria bacterium]|nr:hypothetical protein [Gammaproteobacteria bacterium]
MTFWLSTVVVETLGSHYAIYLVKRTILFGLFLLIPAIMATGISGNILARGKLFGLIKKKKKRMAIIAANGLIILIPSAIILYRLSAAQQFTTVFYSVQGVELIAGAANMVLIIMNIADGVKLSRACRRTTIES